MADVPQNVLPDQEGTSSTVEDEVIVSDETESTDAGTSTENTTTDDVDESGEAITPKGSKTPETALYASLKEERALRKEEQRRNKELERRLQVLEGSSMPSADEEIIVDVHEELRSVKKTLAEIKRDETMRKVIASYPQLASKQDEFDEFLDEDENKNISLQRAAVLFLAEKGLLNDGRPRRRGVESPTGGSKTPPQKGMSAEDVQRLRINSPKKYKKMLMDGKIKPEEIT